MDDKKEVTTRTPLSIQIIEEKSKKAFDSKVYTEEESKYYAFLLKQIENARIQRDTPYKFFDDMTFSQAYVSNQDAANTYLQKKKNKNEIRVNTGTTEKKIETIWNELNSLNIKPRIYSFDDQDNEEITLGTSFTNIVRRTNQIENDDEYWSDFCRELLTQPAVFLYENYVQKWYYDKRKNGQFKYRRKYCQKSLLSGLQVYLGDITIPARRFQEQPYIVIQEKVTYEEARQVYGDNPNWKYVKEGRTGAMAGLFDYKLTEKATNEILDGNSVEIIHYFNSPDDEYNCLVNGVMMFKAGEKLPYEKEGYNVEMIVLKPMSTTFAYGKPLVASAKYLQAIDNETIRLFIRRFRQKVNPAIGVKRGRMLSKDIFEPGTMHQGIGRDNFEFLLDHNGNDNGDLAFMQVIQDVIKEFVGTNDMMSGQAERGNPTATEILRLQRQALKMLGLSVAALRRAHAKMAMLRLYNVLENETDPVFKKLDAQNQLTNIFKKYSLGEAQLPDGSTGTYNVQFTDRKFSEEDERAIYLKEQEDKAKGKPSKYVFINVDELRKIPRLFYATANSEQEKNSELDKALFSEQVQQVANLQQLTGRRPNGDKLIENFERTWGVEDMFMDEGQSMQNPEADPRLQGLDEQLAGLDENPDNLPSSIMQGAKMGTQQPSLNTLTQE